MKIIRMLLPNLQAIEYSLDSMLYLQAEQGATYSVVDLESGMIVEHAVLTRQEDALLIEIEGEQVATLEQFYAEGMAASVDMGAPVPQVATNDAVTESADLVWEHAADAGAVVDGGILSAPLLVVGSIAAGGVYLATNDEDTTPDAPVVNVPSDTPDEDAAPDAPVVNVPSDTPDEDTTPDAPVVNVPSDTPDE
ncbi:MAG: hypothetical protein ACI9W6_000338, partial [Motiliproteus sp.]